MLTKYDCFYVYTTIVWYVLAFKPIWNEHIQVSDIQMVHRLS